MVLLVAKVRHHNKRDRRGASAEDHPFLDEEGPDEEEMADDVDGLG